LLDMIINHNATMPDEGLNTEEMLKEKLYDYSRTI